MSSPQAQPPPDITSYVDLRPFDVTDQEMVDTAVAALKLNLPGWIPREGNTEIVLIEALALEMAEGIVAVNRVPGAVVAAILHLAGVDQDYGNPPQATAQITFGDLLGHQIPPGTRMYLELSDSSTVTFLVEPPGLTVSPGDSVGSVSLIGDVFTSAANGVPAGIELIPADPTPFIDSIVLTSTVTDGRDPESDEAWRNRGVQRLSRLSDALVVEEHFRLAALERPEVAAALALDLYDPASGNAPGADAGNVTVAVLGDGGALLSVEAKDLIRTDLESRSVAMLGVHVVDVDLEPIAVSANIVANPGADTASVDTAVVDAVTAYLDPLGWTFGPTIYRNELISLVDQVAGVARVVDIVINGVAADYTLAGVAVLPQPGTIDAAVTQ